MLLRINDKDVKTVGDVERVAEDVEPGETVSLRVLAPQSGDELIVNYRARR